MLNSGIFTQRLRSMKVTATIARMTLEERIIQWETPPESTWINGT